MDTFGIENVAFYPRHPLISPYYREMTYTVEKGAKTFQIPRENWQHGIEEIRFYSNDKIMFQLSYNGIHTDAWYLNRMKMTGFSMIPLYLMYYTTININLMEPLTKDTDVTISFGHFKDPEQVFSRNSTTIWNPYPFIIQDGTACLKFMS